GEGAPIRADDPAARVVDLDLVAVVEQRGDAGDGERGQAKGDAVAPVDPRDRLGQHHGDAALLQGLHRGLPARPAAEVQPRHDDVAGLDVRVEVWAQAAEAVVAHRLAHGLPG